MSHAPLPPITHRLYILLQIDSSIIGSVLAEYASPAIRSEIYLERQMSDFLFFKRDNGCKSLTLQATVSTIERSTVGASARTVMHACPRKWRACMHAYAPSAARWLHFSAVYTTVRKPYCCTASRSATHMGRGK